MSAAQVIGCRRWRQPDYSRGRAPEHAAFVTRHLPEFESQQVGSLGAQAHRKFSITIRSKLSLMRLG